MVPFGIDTQASIGVETTKTGAHMTSKDDDGKAGHELMHFPAERRWVGYGITATSGAAEAFRGLPGADRAAVEETIFAKPGVTGERQQFQLKSARRTISFEVVAAGSMPHESCIVRLEVKNRFSTRLLGRGAYRLYLGLAISYYLLSLIGKLLHAPFTS